MFKSKNAVLVVALAVQLALQSQVFGQVAYRKLELEKVAAGETSKAQGMLKGKDGLDEAVMKRYVKNEMAKLTFYDQDLSSFANIRGILLMNIRSGGSDAAKKSAAETLVNYARGIAGSADFHPASRVNAMVALSELDVESNAPYLGTFVALEGLAKNPSVPLHLRSIALFGLNRHARTSNLPAARKDVLAKDMTAIVSSQPASPLDTKAHAWMVRRAFDVLTSLATNQAVEPAIARLLDDKELPSLRLAATDYLAKVDLSEQSDEKKIQYFIGLAQMLEQQLVMWYEREEDSLKMKSGEMGGGMGGMGGMMGSSSMGSSEGMSGMGSSSSEGYGEGMSSMGMGGMGGKGGMGSMGSAGMGSGGMGPKPKPLETQPWEVRLSRRMVNQILQTAHVALDGTQVKNGKAISVTGKGLVDLGLPAEVSEPASDLVKAIESLQTRVNDSYKITTMNSLLSQSKKPIEKIMDLVRDVPALTVHYPKYQEKDELNEVAEESKESPPAGSENDPAAAGADAVDVPAPGNTAPGNTAPGNTAPGNAAPGNAPGNDAKPPAKGGQ